MSFAHLTLTHIRARCGKAAAPFYRVHCAYDSGDHWQGGTGWVGPMPTGTDPESAAAALEIQKAFTAKNAIGEIVTRHLGGVIGREPAWSFIPRRRLKANAKPTRAEQALIAEAESALTTWWDTHQIHQVIKAAARTLLLGEATMLRLVVHGLVGGVVPPGDLASSLDRISVDALDADQGTVEQDATTRARCAMATFTDGTHTWAETSYRDGEATVLAVIGQDGTQIATLPLGGRLTMQQARRAAFLTAPIRQNQNQLNLAKTMLGRNVIQGGFLERIFLNAQGPGDWIDDPSAAGGRRFVPKPLRTGAGRTNFVSGQPIRDSNGSVTGYSNASVVFRDPVKVDTFDQTALSAYRSILEEAQQVHALIAGDATVSAVSRVQARADFEASLRETKVALDVLIRWLLETALALACVFSGQVGRFETLRAVCDCRIDTGPLTPEERTAIAQLVTNGLLSRETAMSLLGVEDVDAEIARIEAEAARRQQAALAIAQAQAQTQQPTNQQPTNQQPTNQQSMKQQSTNQQPPKDTQ